MTPSGFGGEFLSFFFGSYMRNSCLCGVRVKSPFIKFFFTFRPPQRPVFVWSHRLVGSSSRGRCALRRVKRRFHGGLVRTQILRRPVLYSSQAFINVFCTAPLLLGPLYRESVLNLVSLRCRAALSHPSVSPYGPLTVSSLMPIKRIARPVVLGTQEEWGHRIV